MGTRSTRSSKFAGATTNFLASLNPARWGRCNERAYHKSEDSLTALADLRDIVLTSDISPFEVNHSGLVKSLLGYLTRPGEDRQERIRQFLHVFAKCPLISNMLVEHKDCSAEPMAALIAKLNGCVSQLEQLPVKVHDLPAGTGSTTALKFFNTHQL